MEMRKSGKITIGIIAALGTIGALHFFIFQERAALYEQQKAAYDAVVGEYRQQGRAPDPGEMYAFRYETLRHQLDYYNSLLDYNFYLPNYYQDISAIDIRDQRREFWDVLEALQTRRDLGQPESTAEVPAELQELGVDQWPQLTFLGDRGWSFATDLPQPLRERGIAIEDVMVEIRNTNRLLNALSQGSDAFNYQNNVYRNLLSQVGLDMNRREQIKRSFGELAASLHTLNRIEVVMDRLPEDFWPADTSETAKLNEMYDLFRMEWPKNQTGDEDLHRYMRQGHALVDLLDTAGENGVQEIQVVRGHLVREIRWRDRSQEVEEEQTPQQMGMDEFSLEMMMMGGGMGMDPNMMGRMGGFGQQMAPPEPEGEAVALGVPIEMRIVGDNASIMSFLYEAVNDREPIELDRLEIRSEPVQNAPVIARPYFNVLGYAHVSGLYTQYDLQKKVRETMEQMFDIATRPGARELAEQDGIVRQSNGQWQLAAELPPLPEQPGADAPAQPSAPR